VDRDLHALDVFGEVVALDVNELLGSLERQALPHRTIDDAEHDRRQADPQAQREHGDQARARVLPEHSHCVTQFLQQSADHLPFALIPLTLSRERRGSAYWPTTS
jgi:hypothetical protein